MGEVGTYSVENGIGIIEIDSPPVNALGFATRKALDEGFARMTSDPAVEAIVLMCRGRTFFAGADITELGKPIAPPSVLDIFEIIENGSRPVIAAIHGTGLGGGYELALVCHYRIAVPSAKLGLPEVNLGLLPGGGGTQRLTRLVGAEAALELLTKGTHVPAPRALELGMIDALAEEGKLRAHAIAFARSILAEGRPLARVRDRQDKVEPARATPEIFDRFREANAAAFRGLKAPANIILAVEAAVNLPFEKGLAREWELFTELRGGTESRARRYNFFAERQAAKVPDIEADTPTTMIASVGIVGTGPLAAGITTSFLNSAIPVVLVDKDAEKLAESLEAVRRNINSSAKKGRISAETATERLGLLSSNAGIEALAEADLVIDAAYGDPQTKLPLFAQFDAVAKPGAILATSTSLLELDEIAAATSRPGKVVGLHFFAPAHVMRLLEAVRGSATDPSVIATVVKLAKAIGKVAVLSRVSRGFIGHRVISARMPGATRLLLEGTPVEAIDRAIYDFGFAIGPFQMADMIGLDVLSRGSEGRTVQGDLVERGRTGQKNRAGYYDYDEQRRPMPSPAVAEIAANVAAAEGLVSAGLRHDEEIIARLLYPVVNEGAKLLEEGVAIRASDIDVACILGYNWPAQTGGPMFWADTVGLPAIVAKLRELEAEYGDAYAVAPSLAKLAAEGGSLSGAAT